MVVFMLQSTPCENEVDGGSFQHIYQRKCLTISVDIGKWFSTFILLLSFNTVPQVTATPKHELISIATS